MAEHYYTESPESEIREIRFDETMLGVTLHLTSVSGVFSFSDRVDRVSALLIRHFAPSVQDGAILDVGCGYGAIGLFLKALHKRQVVAMTDINNRAADYATINMERNHLHAEILRGSLYEPVQGRRFSDIVSNPPFAAGKALLLELIKRAPDHLHPGGSLWLVAHHNKGGETLRKAMAARFGNVADVAKEGGVRVYRSTLAASPDQRNAAAGGTE